MVVNSGRPPGRTPSGRCLDAGDGPTGPGKTVVSLSLRPGGHHRVGCAVPRPRDDESSAPKLEEIKGPARENTRKHRPRLGLNVPARQPACRFFGSHGSLPRPRGETLTLPSALDRGCLEGETRWSTNFRAARGDRTRRQGLAYGSTL